MKESSAKKSKRQLSKQEKTYTDKLESAKTYLRKRNKYILDKSNKFVYKDHAGRLITDEVKEKIKKESVVPLRKII